MVFILKPTDKTVIYYIIGCVLGGGVFWSLPLAGAKPPAIWQLLAIALFCAAVFLLIRYRLTSFRLSVTKKNSADAADAADLCDPSGVDFVIERSKGKRYVALLRLSLSTVRRARIVKSSELKTLTEGKTLYRYTTALGLSEGALITFYSSGENICVFTEMPAEMLSVLARAASQNVTDDNY